MPRAKRFYKKTCAICRGEFEIFTDSSYHRITCSKKCMSISKKLNMSGKNIGKKRVDMLGRNNPNWRGGVVDKNHAIRTSSRMKQWRTSVFERDNYTCQDCGQRGGQLQADHIKSFAYYPKLRFELYNGRTLCVDCHRKTPTYKINQWYKPVGEYL